MSAKLRRRPTLPIGAAAELAAALLEAVATEGGYGGA
jgi:hypothetical protein